jgi:hypothetical protein
MPIVFGGLLISVLLLAQVLGLIALHKTSLPLVRGLLGGWAEQGGFRKWFLRAIGVTALAHAIEHVVHRVRQAIARAAVANLHPVTRYFQDLRALAHFTYAELGAFGNSIADSIGLLIHHKIPSLIHRVTNPIDARARAALNAARRSISLIHSLDHRLSRLLHGIDRLVRDSVIPRVRAAEHAIAGVITRDLPALRRREAALEREVYGDLRARIGRIERALGLGVFAALVYKILAKVAPWLFCRNVNTVGRAVCGLNPNQLNALLGVLLGVLAVEDIRTLARFAESIENEFAQEVKRLTSAF